MTLHDGDIAALAREAVDHVNPALDVHITPAAQDDPYRFGTPAWTVTAGGASSYLTAEMSWRDALDKLIRDLGR